MRHNKFLAALKGINLDESSGVEAKEKVEEMKRRIAAKQSGRTDEEFEFDELGLDIEIEE